MGDGNRKLSERSISVLEMISAGCTYEQILSAYPDFTYLDIFDAAEEALEVALLGTPPIQPSYTVAEKRERYPRAYERWTDAEDAELRELVRSGSTVARIAGCLQRNRGAIRSRIMKLSLVSELTPKEQQRLHRMVAREGDSEEG